MHTEVNDVFVNILFFLEKIDGIREEIYKKHLEYFLFAYIFYIQDHGI